MNILQLARDDLKHFKAYASARDEGTPHEVMLDANESPWPVGDADFNRYPEPQPRQLKQQLAGIYGVEPERLLLTCGSDMAIDLVLRGFCDAGKDSVLISPPTFGMYKVAAQVQGARVLEAPLDPHTFALDAAALADSVQAHTKVVFVCSPNNPTGGVVPLATIETLARQLASQALLVVDEAYIEFADTTSAITLLDAYPNLVILRTLSKAWGLAGVRMGALLADAQIIGFLRAIMAPYALPKPSILLAQKTVTEDGRAMMQDHVQTLLAERERLHQALVDMPGVREVIPSRTNFLCVRFAAVDAVYRHLLAHDIVVRNATGYPGLEDALRISVGTPAENTRVLSALDVLLRKHA